MSWFGAINQPNLPNLPTCLSIFLIASNKRAGSAFVMLVNRDTSKKEIKMTASRIKSAANTIPDRGSIKNQLCQDDRMRASCHRINMPRPTPELHFIKLPSTRVVVKPLPHGF